jgi:transcriptional regulator with XRE-family HTH domain
LTQEQLAKKAKLTQGYISMILKGDRRPSWDQAKKLAKLTGTDPALWMEGTPKKKSAALKKAA